MREGLDDYRRLITLDRLAKEHPGTPAAKAARELIDTRMKAFHLGQRDHDASFRRTIGRSFAAKWTMRSRGSPDRINFQGLLTKV